MHGSLSGLAGSPAISTVGVSLADLFDGVGIPRAIAVWGSSASLGPIRTSDRARPP